MLPNVHHNDQFDGVKCDDDSEEEGDDVDDDDDEEDDDVDDEEEDDVDDVEVATHPRRQMSDSRRCSPFSAQCALHFALSRSVE